MLLKIVFGLSLVIIHQFCYCEDHIYGHKNAGDKTLFSKVLYNQSKEEGAIQTKNYTLIFKYMASETSPNITGAHFKVDNANKSYATIEVNAEKGQDKTLQLMLNIVNGSNVTVSGWIFGPSVNILTDRTLQQYAKNGQRAGPKTMTVVYAHNSTQTRNRKIILGHRQPGDRLIQFESKNVTFMYRFAESEFKYHNEKQFITAVGFSFDSPSAIAFLNSTFVGEHGIDAIVYDLNVPMFEANMTVYGYEHFEKPETYKPIVYYRKKIAQAKSN